MTYCASIVRSVAEGQLFIFMTYRLSLRISAALFSLSIDTSCLHVSGGEDGVVRILDTSGWLSGRSTGNVTVENNDGDVLGVPSGSPSLRPLVSPPKSCRPNDAGGDSTKAGPSSSTQTILHPQVATATVLQVLPSHESSVGAVTAVETPEGVYGEPGGDVLIASGGGKMEIRTWCLGGRVGKNSDGEKVGEGSRNAGAAVPHVSCGLRLVFTWHLVLGIALIPQPCILWPYADSIVLSCVRRKGRYLVGS